MNTELIRSLAAEYRTDVLEDGQGRDKRSPAEMSTDEILEKLAAAGLRMDRARFAELAAAGDSIEDMVMDALFDDIEFEDEDLVPLLRELWVRFVPDRPHLEEVAEVAGWLDFHYPDRGAPAPAAAGKGGDGEGGEADGRPAPPDPARGIAAVEALLDWFGTGPDTPLQRFNRLDDAGPELGVALENAVGTLAKTRPDDALRLSKRLAELTDQPFDWALHADVLADVGRKDEAEALYAKVIEREPWNVWHLKNAALLFGGTEDAPPSDAAKARSYLDRAEALAVERLEKWRNGEEIETGDPSAGEDAFDGDDGFDDEEAPDLEDELLGDLETVLEEQVLLAQRVGDAARAARYEERLGEVQEELGEFEDADEEEYDEDEDEDGGNGDGEAFAGGPPIVNPAETVGRNEVCPCGSGKKYKKCCWLKS